ncbi:formylglycine-generating enzyme family protein [bacterium]|nr:formylglycine-generating enzyme family protein [bacterium]
MATDILTLSNGMEFMHVPAGKFLMGSTEEDKSASSDEHPQHTVDIPYDYWIARFPITNKQYDAFSGEKGGPPPFVREKGLIMWWNNVPAGISWTSAMAYCKRLNHILDGKLPQGSVLRLPTEAEWEKAARGTDGRLYPWGNEFSEEKCNAYKSVLAPVGSYSPLGDSPYGCADMIGNAKEWCHSLYSPYPYKSYDGREDEKDSGARVLRGSSIMRDGNEARCAARWSMAPNDWLINISSFRLVLSPFPKKRGVLDLLKLRAPSYPLW